MERKKVGSKFDSDLDIKDIAKRVRADIAFAVRAGELPQVKCSVKISRYSGGQRMSVTLREVPVGFEIANDAGIRWQAENPGANSYCQRAEIRAIYSLDAAALLEKVESVVQAYNYDNSDSMTDYFDVNFYGHVAFDADLVNASRVRVAAAVARELAPTVAEVGDPPGKVWAGYLGWVEE